MALFISIILSILLGFLLFVMGPIVGGILAFGIIVGCLFRGLSLLNDIHKRISKVTPKPDRAREAYENYLKEKEAEEQG
ncbi:hypothetical protein [Bacillus solimangrovi]|uniref:ATP-dependent Lon protease n=1 Tax=Bacillus solimangrovi TaxID=1305675 RepID=A0A1E5LAD0_9BACI|nr:hypothetical protein [Bacillus solimangrovi]OEH91067.1 hypothetical protein BFG57_06755 [Bacillus solimangrovi]